MSSLFSFSKVFSYPNILKQMQSLSFRYINSYLFNCTFSSLIIFVLITSYIHCSLRHPSQTKTVTNIEIVILSSEKQMSHNEIQIFPIFVFIVDSIAIKILSILSTSLLQHIQKSMEKRGKSCSANILISSSYLKNKNIMLYVLYNISFSFAATATIIHIVLHLH